METNQKTMKNHETTLKNHGNQPKTMKNIMSLTGGSNRPPLVQKRHVTDRGIQPTSFGAKTSRHGHGDPTDLLDV